MTREECRRFVKTRHSTGDDSGDEERDFPDPDKKTSSIEYTSNRNVMKINEKLTIGLIY